MVRNERSIERSSDDDDDDDDDDEKRALQTFHLP
jgi:hypothetical protein